MTTAYGVAMTEHDPEHTGEPRPPITMTTVVEDRAVHDYAVGDMVDGNRVVAVRETTAEDFALMPPPVDSDPMDPTPDDVRSGVVLTVEVTDEEVHR